MKRMRNILKTINALFILLVISAVCYGQNKNTIDIIPLPTKYEISAGSFSITSETKIYIDQNNPEVTRIAEMLSQRFKKAAGFAIVISKIPGKDIPKNSIYFKLSGGDSSLGSEGYLLSAKNNNLVITASEPAGLFYGMQTILQLLPAEIESESVLKNVTWKIPSIEIADKPRFQWRGMHLDVGRHFMPVEFIKKYIDGLAMHKLNVFHWHLTEDQGWRIEIKRYPLLTSVGGFRNGTIIGHPPGSGNDSIRYGGFYTQEQIKEIVKYAQERFITIIPEIEMPGHSSAAIAAYPQLSCFPDESTKIPDNSPWAGPREGKQVQQSWGVFEDVYCPSEYTFKFLENVLDEVMELFPSKYIHIGGDECPKEAWKRSEFCQKLIKDKNLKDENGLQSYFIQRIEKYLNSKGRKTIGWDEILEGGLAPNATVMSWRGEDGGIAAAKMGHNVIMTPIQSLYFWTYQGDPKTEPLAAEGYIALKKVYQYEPVPKALSPEDAKYVLGAQGCAWTEYMESPKKVEYMVFPRISALAELAWSPKKDRNWESFSMRMGKQFKRYDYLGINYAKTPLDINIGEKN